MRVLLDRSAAPADPSSSRRRAARSARAAAAAIRRSLSTVAVDVRGVEERDAGVDRRLHRASDCPSSVRPSCRRSPTRRSRSPRPPGRSSQASRLHARIQSAARGAHRSQRRATAPRDQPAGLALGAVADGVLLEVDLRDRRAAHVAGLAQLPGARGTSSRGLSRTHDNRARVRARTGSRRPGARRRVLLRSRGTRTARATPRAGSRCPGAADPAITHCVEEQRVQAPRLTREDLAHFSRVHLVRLQPEVPELKLLRPRVTTARHRRASSPRPRVPMSSARRLRTRA